MAVKPRLKYDWAQPKKIAGIKLELSFYFRWGGGALDQRESSVDRSKISKTQPLLQSLAPNYTRLYNLNVICFCLLGIVLAFVMPPFQGPDENTHWRGSIARLTSEMGPDGEKCSAAYALERGLRLHRLPFRSERKVQTGLHEKIDELSTPCIPPEHYHIGYGNFLTYPSVVVGSLLFPDYNTNARSALKLFYTSRILAGLFIAFLLFRLGSIASKRLNYPSPGLLSAIGICISPLFVQQSFTVSADSIILMSTIASAIILISTNRIMWLDYLQFMILASISVVTKPVMAPIFMAVCLSPLIFSSHSKADERQSSPSRSFVSPNIIAVSGIVLILISLVYFLKIAASLNPGESLAHMPGIDSSKQARFMMENPIFSFKVLWVRIMESFQVFPWVAPLGWLDTHVSNFVRSRWWTILRIYIVIDGIILASYLFSIRHRIKSQIRSALTIGVSFIAFWTAILISALASVLAMYLYWTPVGGDQVLGVQQRYFFPNAFIFFIGFTWSAHLAKDYVWPLNSNANKVFRLLSQALILSFFIIAIMIVVSVFLDLKIRYY